MKHLFIFLFFLTSLNVFGQTKVEKKAAEQKAYENLKTQLNNTDFQFIADWANTQKGRRINLIGNPNFLNYGDTKIEADLPYFGVAQMTGYNSTGGIKFIQENPVIKKELNDKKQNIILKFEAQNGNESFNCTLTLFKNNTATLSVFSSNRNSISYDGRITFKEQ
ncbi:DUF4251 domain-containing protein [Namhaeicola litoreus]|uniref:DUF4251 domain-containing protein n=1 Tax=Namhaeicola litoreus TaxID=1052145 RepID=A0ABW3XY55_9FLAO